MRFVNPRRRDLPSILALVPALAHSRVGGQRHGEVYTALQLVHEYLLCRLGVCLGGFDDELVVYLQNKPCVKSAFTESLINPYHGYLDNIRRAALDGAVHGNALAEAAKYSFR